MTAQGREKFKGLPERAKAERLAGVAIVWAFILGLLGLALWFMSWAWALFAGTFR